jgi:DNA (cytosine-5)-methyltransferase 1
MKHTIVGLFAGIGGIERGMARGGHDTLLLCENDPAAVSVLKHRFPDISLHGDVRLLKRIPADTTMVAAGFPCQDLSQAGRTAGIDGARSGLIGEVIRLIERQNTPWILLENVPFMLQLAGGNAMNVIAMAFESLGYKWAYRTVDARAFGLPQRRRRIYFVASREGDPRSVLFADEAGVHGDQREFGSVACGFYWTEGIRGLGWAVDSIPALKGGSTIGIPSAPAIVLPSGEVGTPDIRDAERLQGFPSNWTKQAEAVARPSFRWKLVGNAVSVKAAEWLAARFKSPGKVLPLEISEMRPSKAWPNAGWNVGEGRMQVRASEWPLKRPYKSLEEFLSHPLTPLSAKATAGFISRAEKGGLRFQPNFLATVRDHLRKMQSHGERVASRAA